MIFSFQTFPLIFAAFLLLLAASGSGVYSQETESPSSVDFTGHYRQISATNYDAFLKEIGLPAFKRAIGSKLVTENFITRKDDDSYTVRSKTTFTDTSITFKSGVEFNEERADGSNIRSVVTIEGNKWTHRQFSSPEVTVVREFYTKGMVITMSANDVVAVKKMKRLN